MEGGTRPRKLLAGTWKESKGKRRTYQKKWDNQEVTTAGE